MRLPVCPRRLLALQDTHRTLTDSINLSVLDPALLTSVLDGMEQLEASPPVVPERRGVGYLMRRQGPTPNNIVDSHSPQNHAFHHN